MTDMGAVQILLYFAVVLAVTKRFAEVGENVIDFVFFVGLPRGRQQRIDHFVPRLVLAEFQPSVPTFVAQQCSDSLLHGRSVSDDELA